MKPGSGSVKSRVFSKADWPQPEWLLGAMMNAVLDALRFIKDFWREFSTKVSDGAFRPLCSQGSLAFSLARQAADPRPAAGPPAWCLRLPAVNSRVGGDYLVVEGLIPATKLREAWDQFKKGNHQKIITSGGPVRDQWDSNLKATFADWGASKLVRIGPLTQILLGT